MSEKKLKPKLKQDRDLTPDMSEVRDNTFVSKHPISTSSDNKNSYLNTVINQIKNKVFNVLPSGQTNKPVIYDITNSNFGLYTGKNKPNDKITSVLFNEFVENKANTVSSK